DIKPENILLHDGRALVADFGIALAASKAGGTRMTETGMSLGTPHYMSPEQAMGEREITARSDVYALGCVLYEMLTGEPPFTGVTAQAIVARVVTESPRPMVPQRHTIPIHVEAAVLTALEKLPADRFATAAEFAEALANPAATVARTAMRPTAVPIRRGWIAGGALAVLGLIVGLLLGSRISGSGDVGQDAVVRATLGLGDSAAVRAIGNLRLAIDPAGQRIAFVGADGTDESLWVRDLNQAVARPLRDTKGAFAPFFSPDGRSIGFFTTTGTRAQLKVISIADGTSRTLVPDSVASYGGADWGDNGQIYFTHARRGLARVPAAGGAVTMVSQPDSTSGVLEHDYPDVLPGSRRALVMLWKGSIGANHIGVIDLKSGEVTDLTQGSYARFAAPGFVVIGTSEARVLAVRFDPDRGRLLGTPAIVLQDVQQEASNGTVQFAVSESGALAYQGRTTGSDGLVWVDRSGGRIPVDSSMTGSFGSVALSPDGTQIAVSMSGGGGSDIWIKQLSTGAFSRLPFGENSGADRPVWTTDGRGVAFLATRTERRTAWVRRADGSDSARAAARTGTRADEIAFDPLGRYVILRTEGAGPGTRRLMAVPTAGDSTPRMLVSSQFDHYAMTLSPDGNWLAYVSEESGTPEVYVRPFPNTDSARIAVSVSGGQEPVWRRDGKELFFRDPRGAMYAVAVTTGAQFTHGSPSLLFAAPGLAKLPYHRAYDVHPDGKRFLMITSGGLDSRGIEVILNWRVELERLEKAAK
ncbi:MAG TPA: protein kinase, partial [Gemmatimonadales bacterium]|nr:protein kinase [Gemmatimonadales bacterium]